MKFSSLVLSAIFLAVFSVDLRPVNAAPVLATMSATVTSVTGSFTDQFTPGVVITGSYGYDTDEAAASSAITTPSVVPGHEFTSFYEFSGPPYGVSIQVPELDDGLDVPTTGVVVNNDLTVGSAEVGGLLPAGTYDWIELLASTTVDICLVPGGCAPDEFQPADGVEFTLAIFSDTGWFADGSVVPDILPEIFTPIFVGIEYDISGAEIGFIFASVDGFSTADAVSEPSVAALFGLGVLTLLARRRRGK